MPWGKKVIGKKLCVYKKSDGSVLHCYPNSKYGKYKANKYLAALHIHEPNIKEGIWVEKEDAGYRIIAVSTAAVEDKEGETFDTQAIDYDIEQANMTGKYPEFRMFHNSKLGIGRVEKMSRVGIFAVDEGHAYTDKFSLEVCEKMLSTNNGKWRVSRGFYVLEAKGDCPHCSQHLVLQQKHMIAGFKCPSCKSLHPTYKGVLKHVHFCKTLTFDDSITDIPCVPYTGVAAIQEYQKTKEFIMNKQELHDKLLESGLSEDAITERLKDVSDERLKELSDIPFAEVLKETEEEVKECVECEKEEIVVTFDKDVLDSISEIVKKEISSALDGLQIEIPEAKQEGVTLDEVCKKIDMLTEMVSKMLETDEEAVKEIVKEMPREGKLRIIRAKGFAVDSFKEPVQKTETRRSDVIVDSNGNEFANLTEFITKK